MAGKALVQRQRRVVSGLRRLSGCVGQLGGWNEFRTEQYGWEPEADAVCIVPLVEWEEGDLEELFRMLWRAASRIERSMWVGRNDRRDLFGRIDFAKACVDVPRKVLSLCKSD